MVESAADFAINSWVVFHSLAAVATAAVIVVAGADAPTEPPGTSTQPPSGLPAVR